MNARIQELQTTCKKEGKESILVFRGFSAPFVRELFQLPQAVLSAETVLGKDGYLHPEQVLASAGALLSALETHSGPAVMIYEQLLALGILGEYIGKIYMEVKHRPRFVIERVQDDSPAGETLPADRNGWK